MGIKKKMTDIFTRKKLLYILISFIFTGLVFTQENTFKQKLSWKPEKNALKYKIEIQNVLDSSIIQEFETSNNFIEFSMKAGEYKYRIAAYDFLGRKASETTWKDFTILKAVKPEVFVSNQTIKVAENAKNSVKIPVDIQKVTPRSSAILLNEETGETLKGDLNLKQNNTNLTSGSVTVTGISEGKWKVVITNPSGLKTESESINVVPANNKLIIGTEKNVQQAAEEEKIEQIKKEQQRQNALAEKQKAEQAKKEAEQKAHKQAEREKAAELAEKKKQESLIAEKQKEITVKSEATGKNKRKYELLNFKIGAAYPFILYDEYFKSLCEKKSAPGLTAKLTFYPLEVNFFQLGLEASTSATQFSQKTYTFDMEMPVSLNNLNFVSRFNILDGKFNINLKTGGGIAIIKTYFSNTIPPSENLSDEFYGYFCANAGLSFGWFIIKRILFETGADFTNIFMPDMNVGFLTPYMCIGFTF